ncbi:sialidase family protein [Streptomyces huasconensis]|uniref:sialidase family protein n=1 Tax=Streptomyces huasconensis TaxID=1854574 RepID=UPI0033DEDC8B
MTTRDDAMTQEPKDEAWKQAPIAEHRVRMTLRVSRDSGRTWSQVTEVREDESSCPRCTLPRMEP